MRILILLLLTITFALGTPLSDADLEKAIRARFAKSKIAANNFQVKVKNGIATIEGNAAVIQHKGSATRMARTAGASAVVNNIKVSDAAREKAGKQLSRTRRATVKRAP